MLPTELSTGMALVSLALAIISFIAAYGCFHFCMRMARSERDYRSLLLAMQELDDNHEALAASHKRLRSRVGMRELREKRKDERTVSENGADGSVDDWKRRKRLELFHGK